MHEKYIVRLSGSERVQPNEIIKTYSKTISDIIENGPQ